MNSLQNFASLHRVPVSDVVISMRHSVHLEVLSWYLVFSLIYEPYQTSIINTQLLKDILNECVFNIAFTNKENRNMSTTDNSVDHNLFQRTMHLGIFISRLIDRSFQWLRATCSPMVVLVLGGRLCQILQHYSDGMKIRSQIPQCFKCIHL